MNKKQFFQNDLQKRPYLKILIVWKRSSKNVIFFEMPIFAHLLTKKDFKSDFNKRPYIKRLEMLIFLDLLARNEFFEAISKLCNFSRKLDIGGYMDRKRFL